MKTINICSSIEPKSFTIGFRGENDVTQVVFDYSSWVEEFGTGVCTLLIKRPVDTNAYPVALVYEGTLATWVVSSTDTAYKGSGVAEFVFTVDEQIAKSVVFRTSVLEDIGIPSETPPDPYETWLDTLTELGTITLANAQAAQAAQVGAETAQGKAEDAQTAAESAASRADRDAESASASEKNAADSAAAAGRAQVAAESARDAAQRAQTAAETAQSLSEYAQGKAEDAQESAEREAAAALISAQNAYRDAERAEQAAGTSGYIEIEIDADGHLIYTRTDAVDVDFELVDGHLIMEAI